MAAAEAHARELALANARRAGADQCEVTVSVDRKVAALTGGESIFVEATVSVIARGRPAHARQAPLEPD